MHILVTYLHSLDRLKSVHDLWRLGRAGNATTQLAEFIVVTPAVQSRGKRSFEVPFGLMGCALAAYVSGQQ